MWQECYIMRETWLFYFFLRKWVMLEKHFFDFECGFQTPLIIWYFFYYFFLNPNMERQISGCEWETSLTPYSYIYDVIQILTAMVRRYPCLNIGNKHGEIRFHSFLVFKKVASSYNSTFSPPYDHLRHKGPTGRLGTLGKPKRCI